MPKKVHATIVLDRSGSMESCRADALGAVNSYLRQVRADTDMAARISLVTFDTQSIDVIRDRVPSASCPDLAPDEYHPRAGTPLLDAVGMGAGLLDKHAQSGERAILAVVTDGQENSSREYTSRDIDALLERKQKEDGWLIVYLGADHDSWAQASRLGIRRGAVADFDKGDMSYCGDALFALSARFVSDEDAAFTDEERAAMTRTVPRDETAV